MNFRWSISSFLNFLFLALRIRKTGTETTWVQSPEWNLTSSDLSMRANTTRNELWSSKVNSAPSSLTARLQSSRRKLHSEASRNSAGKSPQPLTFMRRSQGQSLCWKGSTKCIRCVFHEMWNAFINVYSYLQLPTGERQISHERRKPEAILGEIRKRNKKQFRLHPKIEQREGQLEPTNSFLLDQHRSPQKGGLIAMTIPLCNNSHSLTFLMCRRRSN